MRCRDLLLVRRQLRSWLRQPLGRLMREHEKRQIKEQITNLFGYHILQLGVLAAEDDLLGPSRIRHKILADPDFDFTGNGAGLNFAFDQIPLASDSIDAVVVPHVLEFSDEPHAVLREIERILIPEGYMVILTLNPWSLWGLWRLLLSRGGRVPWCGQFLSNMRLRDWLLLLGFEIEKERTFFFRPPFQSGGLMRRLRFLERFGVWACPGLGGVNLMVARKQVVTLTPVTNKRRSRRRVMAGGVVEPTTRNAKRVSKG